MTMTSGRWVVLGVAVALLLPLAGCDRLKKLDLMPAPDKPSAEPDKWIGRWNGPEATSMLIAGGKGEYDITISDLNGPRRYKGTASGARIDFSRDGSSESIRATTGSETGMKWLADKSNCLTIRYGEGFCRD